MTDQWERFASEASRTLDALGWNESVAVYQPTESYTAGDGYEITYPEEPTARLDAALSPPSVAADIDRGGTTESADLTVHLAADVKIAFNDAGETGEALTGLEAAGRQYVVDEAEPQRDVFLLLRCVEVDSWG